mmetsp:Transcript_33253/g.51000  ORF Transcript_33253/g.51000 Transcript_33253/m.51000 type:complete len:125 (-) Transcript_33253:41-415(-)
MASATKAKTLGRAKSGCMWKKGTGVKRSNKDQGLLRKSWEKKTEERKKAAALKIRLNELREAKRDAKKKQKLRTKEKEERKKLNEIRSSKFQVIKHLSKTKKWTRAAKKTLMKLPAEIFYEKFK